MKIKIDKIRFRLLMILSIILSLLGGNLYYSQIYARTIQEKSSNSFQSVWAPSQDSSKKNYDFSNQIIKESERFSGINSKISGPYSYYNFKNAKFQNGAQIVNSFFDLDVDFYSAEFQDTTFFIYTNFKGTVGFFSAKFLNEVEFRNVMFNKKIEFISTEFLNNATFSGVDFLNDVDFRYAIFKRFADFSKSSFNGNVNFISAYLPDSLDFRNVTKISNEIDFTYCKIDSTKNKICRIALNESDIDKIKINMNLFKLYFPYPENTYERITSVYEKLLRKFKKDGLLESYKTLDLEYRAFLCDNSKSFTYKTLDYFQKHWWNYGYNKEWIILSCIKIFIMLCMFNFLLYKQLNNIYKINLFTKQSFEYFSFNFKKYEAGNRINRIWESFIRQFINSVIYTFIIFFGFRLEIDKFEELAKIKLIQYIFLLYILAIYLLGLFYMAYIINIIIVK